eukprot:TRINITY_DN4946_c0_g1_i3.p1 TRINITY_DN4946_c0_g1~~TRINITY_DN4946_c0_g1_i3.p1  ORF type:complete len:966 (-),score=175.07 TRINITY_DN4946_c0_g1_i3:1026-3923(-)
MQSKKFPLPSAPRRIPEPGAPSAGSVNTAPADEGPEPPPRGLRIRVSSQGQMQRFRQQIQRTGSRHRSTSQGGVAPGEKAPSPPPIAQPVEEELPYSPPMSTGLNVPGLIPSPSFTFLRPHGSESSAGTAQGTAATPGSPPLSPPSILKTLTSAMRKKAESSPLVSNSTFFTTLEPTALANHPPASALLNHPAAAPTSPEPPVHLHRIYHYREHKEQLLASQGQAHAQSHSHAHGASASGHTHTHHVVEDPGIELQPMNEPGTEARAGRSIHIAHQWYDDNIQIPSRSYMEVLTTELDTLLFDQAVEYDDYGFPLSMRQAAVYRTAFSGRQTPEQEAKILHAWQQHLQKIDHSVSKLAKSPNLKHLVRNGIPLTLRGTMWQLMSGCRQTVKKNLTIYRSIHEDNANVPSQAVEQIERDIERTFPGHPLLGLPHMRGILRRVLVAYSFYNPHLGYTQAMNNIVGILILFMDEERAFWMLVTIVEHILPNEFYTDGMIGIHTELRVFRTLLAEKIPKLHAHFKSLDFDPTTVLIEWYLCLFAGVLPFETTIRVWDDLFLEGSKILHRVALSVLKLNEKLLLQTQSMGEMMMTLKDVCHVTFDSDLLIKTAHDSLWIGSFGRAHIQALRDQEESSVRQEQNEMLMRRRERLARAQLEAEGHTHGYDSEDDDGLQHTAPPSHSSASASSASVFRDIPPLIALDSDRVLFAGGPLFEMELPPLVVLTAADLDLETELDFSVSPDTLPVTSDAPAADPIPTESEPSSLIASQQHKMAELESPAAPARAAAVLLDTALSQTDSEEPAQPTRIPEPEPHKPVFLTSIENLFSVDNTEPETNPFSMPTSVRPRKGSVLESFIPLVASSHPLALASSPILPHQPVQVNPFTEPTRADASEATHPIQVSSLSAALASTQAPSPAEAALLSASTPLGTPESPSVTADAPLHPPLPPQRRPPARPFSFRVFSETVCRT